MNSLKEKFKNGKVTVGSWITFSDTSVAEIMAGVGFDWLVIDVEHSGLDFAQAQELIRVIDLCGVPPLVRVRQNDADMIKKFMDMGAHGVIVPMVNCAADAKKAVDAVKYPPFGKRGVGLARAQKYSMDLDSYRKWNQKNSIIIVQIEHIDAVNNLEEIMAVDGVDGFIIGLYDLSGSLGCPGDFNNPKVKSALKQIHAKSKKHKYLMGQHIVDPKPELVKAKIKEGFRFIGFSDDFLFLSLHAKELLNRIKK
jgi:2-keto-3-deoxy-L-rhamnonate aldolase RhmA